MTMTPSSPIVITAMLIAVLGAMALAAQDKLTLSVPNGLAFSEFRGYENWENVAVSETENGIKVIVANPTMMAAYREALPADGKHFPDGSKVAKIEWTAKRKWGVSVLRHGTRHSEIGFVHRKGYQAISGHSRMGIRPV